MTHMNAQPEHMTEYDYDENAYFVFEAIADARGLDAAQQTFTWWLMDHNAGSFRYTTADIARYAERFINS